MNKSITELSAALREREFSSEELTRDYLERIERLDGGLNSFITVTAAQALEAARSADARLKSGDPGPVSYTHLTLPTNREV